MRMLHVCAAAGCFELINRGETYCISHANERAARQASRLRAVDRDIKKRSTWRWVYKDPRWTALRTQVKREQPWCGIDGCVELTADVDHKTALQDGGAPFDKDNVWGLCKKHHSIKTREEIRQRAGKGGGHG